MKSACKKGLIQFLVVLLIVSSIPPINSNAEPISKKAESSNPNNPTIEDFEIGEVIEKRTENEKVYYEGKGKYRKEIYFEPIHKKVKGKKNLEEISADLVEDSNNTDEINTENTIINTNFKKKMESGLYAEFDIKGHKINYSILSASGADKETIAARDVHAQYKKKANKILHKNVFPNIDLQNLTFGQNVKEDLVLKSYNGYHIFKFKLETDLEAEIQKDGSIYFSDEKANKIFDLPKPFMTDSNYDDRKGESQKSDEVKYELESDKNGYILTVNANPDWLKAKDRVYPVYIDPTTSINTSSDTFVMSAYPTTNYSSTTSKWDSGQSQYVLKTGYYDGTTGTTYGFLNHSIDSFKNMNVSSATFNVYVTHSYSSAANGLWLDSVNSSWTASKLNWNNKPASTNIGKVDVARDSWAKFNVTNIVKDWASGAKTSYGFKLHTNGNGQTYWKKVVSTTNSSLKPYLSVTYTIPTASTPTGKLYSNGNSTGYANLSWSAVKGATGYKVWIFNGKDYESFSVGNVTSWSTKGKKIWPTASEISAGKYDLHQDGNGTELAIDPSTVYKNSGGSYQTSKNYWFRVSAIFSQGEGPQSGYYKPTLPNLVLPSAPTGTSYSNGNGTGYIDFKWKAVSGATGYKIVLFNGKENEYLDVGNVTSWSTKDKKYWPTSSEISAGRYKLHLKDNAGSELAVNPVPVYKNSGGSYQTSTNYWIRVLAYNSQGETINSNACMPSITTIKKPAAPTGFTYTNMPTSKSGHADLSWNEIEGATGYKVWVFNGKSYQPYDVGSKTTWTSQNKGIWPTATEISEGKYALHTDGKGAELAIDPSPVYKNSGGNYQTKKNYWFRVSAYDQKGETIYSNALTPTFIEPEPVESPKFNEELLGLEDYFTYKEDSFGNATSYVNVTTGNMVLQFSDESLYTRSSLGYDFIRTYNSRSQKPSVLGKGWTFIGNETLAVLENGNVLYSDKDGTIHTFEKKGDELISPKGLYGQLYQVDNSTYTLTDPNGLVLTFKIGKKSNQFFISSYLDEYRNQINFTRNEEDQLITVSEERGIKKQEKIFLEYTDNKISKVKFSDHWTTYTYKDNLLVQTKIGSEQSTRTITENFTYDKNGQLIEYVDGENNETVFSYNENELIILDKQADDEELSVTNTYQFNDKDNEYKSIATDGSETIYKRDVVNNTYAVTQEKEASESENRITFYTLDENYNILEVTNPDGTKVQNTYDKNGNVLSSKSTDGTTTYTYNTNNQLVKSVSANGEITTNMYEGPSLVSTTVKDETTKFTYDSFGRVIQTTFPNGTFETTIYDDDQYSVSSTDKKGNTNKAIYTVFRQKKEMTDAEGNTTKYTYDPLYSGSLTSVTDGNGHKTTYLYDDNNNLTSLTDALGRKKTYTYNNNDQVTKVMMPNMTFQYAYNLNGELGEYILPSGIRTLYSYTEDNQVDSVNIEDKTGEIVETTQYQYDELGNLTQIEQDGKVLKTFSYSEESNLLTKYGLQSFIQSYKYDDKERLIDRATTYNNEFTVNEKTAYKENSEEVDHIQYSVNDNILRDYKYEKNLKDNQNIITLNKEQSKQIFQMNDSNLLSSLTYTTKKQKPFEITYNYMKNGNISNVTTKDQSISYNYDGNNQLIKELFANGEINTYEYDAVGNRVATHLNGKDFTFSYNDANQIVKKNDIDYHYDEDGNLLQDENYKYSYNAQQQLTSVNTLSDEPIATYTYDENGLRLTKTIGNTTHEFFYNDEVLDMEIVQENNTIKQYRSYEWNGNIPLGMIVKEKGEDGYFQTNAYQFITNHRGDVLSIRDAEDNEVASYQYDAYGNILSNEGKLAKENPIRYAGYYYDDETKNYYLQARYYNSENGAFLALDPHPGDDDEPLSQNGYTYANNNPIMNVDANGQSSKRILYALVTGLAFILYELTGTIKGVGTAIFTFVAYIKGYKDFQKAKKESQVELAKKLLKNSRSMKKDLVKQAKKALRKKGIKILAKASGIGWAYAFAVFSDGVSHGYSKKFYNDGLCKKWGKDAYSYATHVADKKA